MKKGGKKTERKKKRGEEKGERGGSMLVFSLESTGRAKTYFVKTRRKNC